MIIILYIKKDRCAEIRFTDPIKLQMKMHPTGIEPALKASEASVLSVRLRVHIALTKCNNLRQRYHYNIRP